jgi:hypothetical protein
VDSDYIKQVLLVLQDNPTASNLDFLVTAYTNLGYLSADAQQQADEADARRKYEVANAYLNAKKSGDKVTDRQAEALAEVQTWDYRTAAIEAAAKASKLKNLLQSVEQAINAIKFIGRYDSPMRLP